MILLCVPFLDRLGHLECTERQEDGVVQVVSMIAENKLVSHELGVFAVRLIAKTKAEILLQSLVSSNILKVYFSPFRANHQLITYESCIKDFALISKVYICSKAYTFRGFYLFLAPFANSTCPGFRLEGFQNECGDALKPARCFAKLKNSANNRLVTVDEILYLQTGIISHLAFEEGVY